MKFFLRSSQEGQPNTHKQDGRARVWQFMNKSLRNVKHIILFF